MYVHLNGEATDPNSFFCLPYQVALGQEVIFQPAHVFPGSYRGQMRFFSVTRCFSLNMNPPTHTHTSGIARDREDCTLSKAPGGPMLPILVVNNIEKAQIEHFRNAYVCDNDDEV